MVLCTIFSFIFTVIEWFLSQVLQACGGEKKVLDGSKFLKWQLTLKKKSFCSSLEMTTNTVNYTPYSRRIWFLAFWLMLTKINSFDSRMFCLYHCPLNCFSSFLLTCFSTLNQKIRNEELNCMRVIDCKALQH